MLHLKITMMLLFANIMLVLTVPHMLMTDNLFFQNSGDTYTLNGEFSGALGDSVAQEEGLTLNSFGITDAFKIVWSFLELLVMVFFASIILIYTLPPVVALMVGIPLTIAYGFAIMGWIK